LFLSWIPQDQAMSLALRLRQSRETAGLSLDELAKQAGISKTYLWELEKDTRGVKKPSADVLLRIASALSVTIGDLLALPTTHLNDEDVELSPSLKAFRDRMASLKAPLSEPDLRDLAKMRFRGGQPGSVDQWHQLYMMLTTSAARKRGR
jgi:transcriptional regulator with XRE-family HTH domain